MLSADEVRLIQVSGDEPVELDACRQIFREYAASLGFDLCFQGFEAELAGLPGEYASSRGGRLYLALVGDEVAGCGALRSLADVDHVNACEMKRLFVRKPFRRFGLGRMLAQSLLEGGREMGYSNVLLDTLNDMEAARELYAQLGFVEVPPYYYNPIPGAHYLCASLDQGSTRF